jgi:hypothetical protein
MIRFILLFIALAAPAAAQVAPISFEAGKALTIAPGQWTHNVTPTGSEARYGGYLIIRCDRAGRIVTILRPGLVPQPLTIATSALGRTVQAGGRLQANDPLLDAIAFSRGRFLVTGGGATLAIPSWPEAARSIEDCRI